MPTAAQTARARARVTSTMADTCVIGERVAGEMDPATGEYPETIDPVYSGRCRFTIRTVQVRDVDSQGQDLAVADGILAIPVDAPGSHLVGKDHVAQITVTGHDTATVTAVIQFGHTQTFATARRFPVQITT